MVAVIYRPPSTKLSTFFQEFSDFISELTLTNKPCLILGDFNIHVNKVNSHSSALIETLDLFGLKQFVHIPTFRSSGNTFDLIISSLPITNITSTDPTSVISDHLLINFEVTLPTKKKTDNLITVSSRPYSHIKLDSFHNDIIRSLPPISALSDCTNSIANQILTTLDKVTDSHAPLKTYTVTPHPNTSWYNENCIQIKREKRSLERKIKKATRLTRLRNFKKP